MSAGWPAQINSQRLSPRLKPLRQHGHRAHHYAELAVSSPAVVETIASTHCYYTRRDGQAEWAWCPGKYQDFIPTERVHQYKY